MDFWPRQNVFKRVVANTSVVANANCGRQPSCYSFAFCVFWLRHQFLYQVCPLICSYLLLLLLRPVPILWCRCAVWDFGNCHCDRSLAIRCVHLLTCVVHYDCHHHFSLLFNLCLFCWQLFCVLHLRCRSARCEFGIPDFEIGCDRRLDSRFALLLVWSNSWFRVNHLRCRCALAIPDVEIGCDRRLHSRFALFLAWIIPSFRVFHLRCRCARCEFGNLDFEIQCGKRLVFRFALLLTWIISPCIVLMCVCICFWSEDFTFPIIISCASFAMQFCSLRI